MAFHVKRVKQGRKIEYDTQENCGADERTQSPLRMRKCGCDQNAFNMSTCCARDFEHRMSDIVQRGGLSPSGEHAMMNPSR